MRHLPPQGDAALLIYDKLETIIDLLLVQIGAQPSGPILAQYPELGELFKRGLTSAGRQQRTNKLLEILTAASLPSAPQNVQTYTVGTTEELLASNMSMPLMRVDVTNLNVAQPLLVSKKGVNPSTGGLILARETASYVLPVSAELYGIVNLGEIIVTVGIGYDIQTIISALLDRERGE